MIKIFIGGLFIGLILGIPFGMWVEDTIDVLKFTDKQRKQQ